MNQPKSNDAIPDIISHRIRRLTIRRGYFALMLRILWIVAITWLLMTQVFLIARTRGNDMFPAIKDGDVVLAFRLQQRYVKADVVAYQQGDARQIGRIIGLAGDIVALDDTGTLRVNGTVQTGEIVYPTYATGNLAYPYRVPEGYVFMLGDNRPQATDSRNVGPIPQSAIEGKVITLLRRRGL